VKADSAMILFSTIPASKNLCAASSTGQESDSHRSQAFLKFKEYYLSTIESMRTTRRGEKINMNDGNLKHSTMPLLNLNGKKVKEDKVFHSEIDKAKPRFSIVIPPPNVTGSLHIGHALTCRFKMPLCVTKNERFNVCWVPALIMQA